MSLVDHVIKQSGRNYAVDAEIPRSSLYAQYAARAAQLLRGLITLQRRVFCGRSVQIMCKRNLVVGYFATLGAGSIIDASGIRGVHLGRGAKIGRRSIVTTTSQLSKRGVGLTIGDYSGVGDYAHIGCSGGVTIGRDVIAGPYVTFHSQEHITASPDHTIRRPGTREMEVIVQDDVWIGARATFWVGAHVRSGSLVAAGSVVREFPANCINGGVPAKILKHRERP